MAFTIEGYTINELIKLGKKVKIVGHLSVSGDAKDVGNTFIALGMFAQMAEELRRRISDEEEQSECVQANWPNNDQGQRVLSLPKLQFVDAKEWLPRDPQIGGIERKYLVRWKDESGASGEALCVFKKGAFWSCGQGLTAKLDVLNNDRIQVEWSPLH